MYVRDDVPSFELDTLPSRRPQRDVQGGPLFRGIDPLALKHGIDPLGEAGFSRQLEEVIESLVIGQTWPPDVARVSGQPRTNPADAACATFDSGF